MKKTSTLVLSLLTLFSLNVLAHGEDKPGPHGGFIKMPGAFHIEVVKVDDGFRVFLLDINWKNPSVLDSSVTAYIEAGKSKTDLVCIKEAESYLCKSKLTEKGFLKIVAKREGQSGGISEYKLPLKFELPKNEIPMHSTDPHQGHH